MGLHGGYLGIMRSYIEIVKLLHGGASTLFRQIDVYTSPNSELQA